MSNEKRKIRALKNVKSSTPGREHISVTKGQIYEAKGNRHGAVSARTEYGLLGLKPDEYEFIPLQFATKPLAGEFTKELRRMITEDCCNYNITDEKLIVILKKTSEACDRLDTANAKNKELNDECAAFEYLLDEAKEGAQQLEAENKAIIRRAEAAESDWQLAEAENKELRQADKTHLSAKWGLEKRYSELEAENEGLLKLTELLDEHPDDYDGPCYCKMCMSYG